MPVPQTLESSSIMQVERTRSGLGAKPMRFGEWQVTQFERERIPVRTKSAIGVSNVSFSRSNHAAIYSFVVTPSAREEWACRCEHSRREKDIGVGPIDSPLELELTYEESLECEIRRAGDSEPWKLRVDGSLAIGGEGYRGTLVQGSRSLWLEPSHEIEGLPRLPGPPIGYLFVREGAKIASAELLPPGHVRIGDEAGADRDAIATAMAALLMQPGPH
jgi:hypothetical protein